MNQDFRAGAARVGRRHFGQSPALRSSLNFNQLSNFHKRLKFSGTRTLQGGELAISIVFFLISAVLAGAVLRQVNRRTRLPYTPLLLIVGLFVGYCHQRLGDIGSGAFSCAFISPHLFIYLFVPVLIFESGFNCDWYIFRRSLVNIVVLAGPGVLLGAVLLGTALKLAYSDLDMNWPEAFTLGSVLSATDPVAVVALLKELGASVRFNTLVEGESLLNDGTAMVFYLVFIQLARQSRSEQSDQQAKVALGSVLLRFFRVSVGGPLLGIGVGAVAAFIVKRIVRDEVLTTCVTFIACFLGFYLAEFTWLQVSGILSLVVLGLYLSAVGRTKIHPQSLHSLHVVWSFLQYVCETLIFLLTGVIIGVRAIDQTSITAGDWAKMASFWVVMQVARLVMVICALPCLNSFGYPLSRQEVIVLVYGGLRGALGLSLALMVYVDESLPNQRFKELTLFYMSGMATLSLLINGTTCSSLVKCLRMINPTPVKDKLFNNCKARISARVGKVYEELEGSRHLAMANWREVRRLCKLQETSLGEDHRDSIGMRPDKIFQELRYRLLAETKRLAWEHYKHGMASSAATRIIQEICDVQQEISRKQLDFWQLAQVHLTASLMPLAKRLRNFRLSKWLAEKYIFDSVYLRYDTSNLLVQLKEELLELCQKMPVKEVYTRKIINELEEQSSKAEAQMIRLQEAYPYIVGAIHTRMAGIELLVARRHEVDTALKQSLLDSSQYKREREQVDTIYNRIEQLVWSEPLTFYDLACRSPLLSTLREDQLAEVADSVHERRLYKGSVVAREYEELYFVYLVKWGSLVERRGGRRRSCVAGEIIPTLGLLAKEHRSNLVASHDCTLLIIKAQALRNIMRIDTAFEQRVFRAAFPQAAQLSDSRLKDLALPRLKAIAQNNNIIKFNSGESISLNKNAFILDGSLAENAFLPGLHRCQHEFGIVPAGHYKAFRQGVALLLENE